MKPGLRVYDHQDDVGLLGCRLGLAARRIRELGAMRDVGTWIDAGGIDQAEDASPPIAEGVQTVTRDAGRVLDDGQAAADEPVEERALTDVRPADDCNGSWGKHGSFLLTEGERDPRPRIYIETSAAR